MEKPHLKTVGDFYTNFIYLYVGLHTLSEQKWIYSCCICYSQEELNTEHKSILI